MERLTKVISAAVLVAASSAAIAGAGDQVTFYGGRVDGTTGLGDSGAVPGSRLSDSSRAGPTPSSGDSSNQDAADLDPLLGAPGDYGDRYASSANSDLENRANDRDGGVQTSSHSQSPSSFSARKSPASKKTLKRSPSATQTGDLSTLGRSAKVYSSPW